MEKSDPICLPVWIPMILGAKHRQQQAEKQHHQTQTNHNYNWKWRAKVIKHTSHSSLYDNIHADMRELTNSVRNWSRFVALHSQRNKTYSSYSYHEWCSIMKRFPIRQFKNCSNFDHDRSVLSIIETSAQHNFDQSQTKHDGREQRRSENLRAWQQRLNPR